MSIGVHGQPVVAKSKRRSNALRVLFGDEPQRQELSRPEG